MKDIDLPTESKRLQLLCYDDSFFYIISTPALSSDLLNQSQHGQNVPSMFLF